MPPSHSKDRIRRVIAAIASGRPVVVVDDTDREDEGDLIFAAEAATPELLAFTIRHTAGYVCVALPGEDCDRLDLPPMHHRAGDRFGTAYRVTVDLTGTGTGISATDRASTIAALASAQSRPEDFVRPGHVVPLQTRAGGVLSRRGHTEAAVDLARLAGMRPAGALCEIVSRERPGEMARGPELVRFAAEHALEIVSVAELATHRRRTEPQVRRLAGPAALPTVRGEFRAIGYRGEHDAAEHLALVAGRVSGALGVPLSVHLECLTADVLGSQLCVCRAALDASLSTVAAAGSGLVVYVRPPGPSRACGLRDRPGGALVEAAAVAASIVDDLAIGSVRLLDLPAELRDAVHGAGLSSNDAPRYAVAG